MPNNKFATSSFAIGLARFTIKYPLWIIAAGILLAAAMAYGIRFLEFSPNYRVFFSSDNPQLKIFEEIERTYTKTDNILFVIRPKQGDVFQPQVLALIKEMTELSWQLPYAQRVDSITNFQHTKAANDELIVADLVEQSPDSLTKEQLAQIKEIALKEPLLAGIILSTDGTTTGINVTVNLARENIEEVPLTVAAARKLIAEMQAKYPDIDIRPSGIVLMTNAFMEASMADLTGIIPIMYAVLIIAMFLFLRSIMATIAAVLVVAFSASCAMGFGGYMGFPLTSPTATVPTIVLTLAIADSIHILISMMTAMRTGMSRHNAIIESMRINMQPVFLTSLTTAIGFLALNFSDTPPFWHLGNMSAFGVMIAFLYSVTFLPALLSIMPIKATTLPIDKTKWLAKLADLIIAYPKRILFTSSAIAIIMAMMISKIELNDQFVQYFDYSIAFRGDTEFMINNLTGIYGIDYNIKAGGPDKINNPAYLRIVDGFVQWLRQQPETKHVYSITDIMKRLNRNMHNDDDAWYKLPDNAQLASQYLLLYELSLPYGLDLNDRINIDKSATRISVLLDDLSTKEIRNFKERSENWLRDNAPEFMRATGTSPVIMFAYISQRNIDSMLTGNMLSLILISICIMVALRSIKIGLFSLVPNIVPVAVGYGIWGLLIGQINMAVAICASVSMGIIVDDSVHFLSKYLRARREKSFTSQQAIHYAFTTVGPALIVTTIILIAGFGMLYSSAFQLNSYLGLLTMIVIACAIIADFLLLPSMLIVIDSNNSYKCKEVQT